MSLFEEASWKMSSAPASDIERTREGAAMNERIAEWFATPVGSVAHNPSWGNDLGRFKHDPQSKGSDLEVRIELDLTRKMPLDIADLKLLYVRCTSMDIDYIRVEIVHQYGTDTREIKL